MEPNRYPLTLLSPLIHYLGVVDVLKGRWPALRTRLRARGRPLFMQSRARSARAVLALEGLAPEKALVAAYAEGLSRIGRDWRYLSFDESTMSSFAAILRDGQQSAAEAASTVEPGFWARLPEPSGDNAGRLAAASLKWAREALATGYTHPFLVAGIFLVRFISAQPRAPHTTRLGLLLTTLLLAREGYEHLFYGPLEEALARDVGALRSTLERASAAIGGDEAELVPWLELFTGALAVQAAEVTAFVEQTRAAKMRSLLEERLLDQLERQERMTMTDAVAVSGANRNTVKLSLRRLLHAKELLLHGKGRGAYYTPIEPKG